MKARTTLVTGGTGGLGRSVVERLLARGDHVVVPWIVEDESRRLRDQVGKTESLSLIKGDVTDEEWLGELARHLEELGGLDSLLNLVGGFTMGSLGETSVDDWERMMTLNARSVFLVTRTMAPLLAASGRGRVVNVSAAAALRPGGGKMAAYVTSKAAVARLTEAMADELGKRGIAVNAIAPTTIDTEANRKSMPKADPDDWVRPEEIAELLAWLTDEHARVVTGNVVVVGR